MRMAARTWRFVMLPSLLVAVAVAAPCAPIPKDATPTTSGPAPRVAAVRADGSGVVWISAQVWEKRKVPQTVWVMENGKQVMKQREVEQNVNNYIHKALSDFGAKFYTADGSTLTLEDANRRLKKGATLLITADGKPISKGWLRAVARDTVIMQTEGLAHAHFQYNMYNQEGSVLPTTAAPRLAMFQSDEAGSVQVAVNSGSGNNNGGPVYIEDIGGGRMIRGRAVAWQGDLDGYYPAGGGTNPTFGKKSLADVKFDAYDLTGTMIRRSDALKRLRAGGLVLLAGDNKFPDSSFLSAFREDILVLVSGEFNFPQGVPNPYDMAVKSDKPPPGTDKPAPADAPVPAGGAVAPAIQLKVAPAAIIKQVQVAPLARPAKEEVKPAEKPAKRD
jgi:hypothetical protein